MPIEKKLYTPYQECVMPNYRYWFRTYFHVPNTSLIVPVSFLIDTGCPNNV